MGLDPYLAGPFGSFGGNRPFDGPGLSPSPPAVPFSGCPAPGAFQIETVIAALCGRPSVHGTPSFWLIGRGSSGSPTTTATPSQCRRRSRQSSLALLALNYGPRSERKGAARSAALVPATTPITSIVRRKWPTYGTSSPAGQQTSAARRWAI